MKHFIKYSYASKENPVLLILDKSYVSADVIRLAKENGVTLLTHPPIAAISFSHWILLCILHSSRNIMLLLIIGCCPILGKL
jgi:type III secretion system FlhB-like substrate exporter